MPACRRWRGRERCNDYLDRHRARRHRRRRPTPTRSTRCSRAWCGRCGGATRSRTSSATATSRRAARPIPARLRLGAPGRLLAPRRPRAPLPAPSPAAAGSSGGARRAGAAPCRTDSGYNGRLCRFLADYFPLILFFVAFKWQGIYVATAVAIVASVAQIAWLQLEARHASRPSTGCRSRSSPCSAARRCCCTTRRSSSGSPRCCTALFGAILAVGKLGFGRNLIALPDAGHRRCRRPCGRASRGRGWRSSRSWPCSTGTSRSTTRPTPGSISRCGAASGCSSRSRWRRACCWRATCSEEPHDDRRRAPPPKRRCARRLAALAPTVLEIARRQRRSTPGMPARRAAAGTFRC